MEIRKFSLIVEKVHEREQQMSEILFNTRGEIYFISKRSCNILNAIYYGSIAMVVFSHMEITCLRAKTHMVFGVTQ